MTTQEFLNLDVEQLMKLNRPQLSKAVSTLAATANKRAARLYNKFGSTYWTEQIEKSGGKFQARGKNLNSLRSEFMRAADFLNAQTSTIKGEAKRRENVAKALGGEYISDKDEAKKFWDAYHEIMGDGGKSVFATISYKKEQLKEFYNVYKNNENLNYSDLVNVFKDLKKSMVKTLEPKTSDYWHYVNTNPHEET